MKGVRIGLLVALCSAAWGRAETCQGSARCDDAGAELAGFVQLRSGRSSRAAADDEVTRLPGWPGPLPSRMYSGYLDIAGGKHYHYIFVEKEGDDSQDAPVFLWLNGGPGCSSLYGFIYEHGPFRVDPANTSQLVKFDWTWAKIANVVYLESPVGVGFSYSDNSSDYAHNSDEQTAEDNLKSMQKFFELFPHLRRNDFFITGESYAGIYVPTLAAAVLKAKDKGLWKGPELKGIAVGNGCAGSEVGVCGSQRDKYEVPYLLGTAFVSDAEKAAVVSACHFQGWEFDWSKPSPACRKAIRALRRQVGNVNLYNIYGPCINWSPGIDDNSFKRGISAEADPSFQFVPGIDPERLPHAPSRRGASARGVAGPVACIDSYLGSTYLNKKAVREALHVRMDIGWPWAVCGGAPNWDYESTVENEPRDVYPELLRRIRVVIYNGDWDACVPYTDNEAWTSQVGSDLKLRTPWSAWTYADGTQVAGYRQDWDTAHGPGMFTFATVKGGRHEVPMTAPKQAFAMINALAAGQPLGE